MRNCNRRRLATAACVAAVIVALVMLVPRPARATSCSSWDDLAATITADVSDTNARDDLLSYVQAISASQSDCSAYDTALVDFAAALQAWYSSSAFGDSQMKDIMACLSTAVSATAICGEWVPEWDYSDKECIRQSGDCDPHAGDCCISMLVGKIPNQKFICAIGDSNDCD